MTDTQNTIFPTSDLGSYLKNELFDKWAKQRKDKVEAKWIKNEDAFNGVSRGFWKIGETEDWRSDTFIKMTKIKVLSAYSIVIDMLLQSGRFPISLNLSPWDNVILEDLPLDQQEIIQDNIDDMSALIQQQILDCQGPMELMKCVMAGARFGETYWKTYIHDITRKGFKMIDNSPEGMPELQQQDQYKRYEYFENQIKAPAFRYVSCWDMFRDMETDDMQRSRGCVERSWASAYDLRQLKGKPYYIDDAIDKVIVNYNKSAYQKTTESVTPTRRKIQDPYNNFQRWEFWCRVPRKTLDNFIAQQEDLYQGTIDYTEPEMDGDEVEVCVCMVNEEVIRVVKIKQDSRPHGRVVWEINLDDDHGIGVADNVEAIQMVLNGMVRAFEDNKKLAANVMAIIKKSMIVDWPGEFKPGEILEASEETDRASDAIQQLIFQDVGDNLLSGIALMERFADELSMLPKIMQGSVAEKRKPDTLGEIEILQANAGKYIASVITNYDKGLLEPVGYRFYEYNMLNPEVKKGKGNYIVKAEGFSNFQYKILRLHKILQGLNLVLSSPELAREVRLKSLLEEVFKSLDIDPQTAFKTREEKENEAQAFMQAQQAQTDQMVTTMLAKMKAEAEKAIAEIEAKHQAKMEELNLEHQQDIEKIAVEAMKDAQQGFRMT